MRATESAISDIEDAATLNLPKFSLPVPAIAQGTVIPASQSFVSRMHSSSGATSEEQGNISDIIRQAIGQMSGQIGGDLTVNLMLDGQKITDVVIRNYNRSARASGNGLILGRGYA